MALRDLTRKYSAIRRTLAMSQYGLWVATYSVAPGVDMAVAVCQNGIDPATAATLADAALKALTGQEVTTP